MITALCGGVGGSKLALGLYRTLPPDELALVVNTADDGEFFGLHVSPDLDTVMYTLAGLARQDVGWGIEGDTFSALQMFGRYGEDTWFQIGDRDLATDVVRSQALRSGQRLTDITARLASRLGIRTRIYPATDARVATRMLVDGEWVEFQDYFVRRRHSEPVQALRYEGIEAAAVSEEVADALSGADAIVLVNSNPALSILPILAIPGMNDLVAGSGVPRVAVSPIVGVSAVTGPAGDLMEVLGYPSSALGVAQTYLGLIDGIVIDAQDAEQTQEIEALGVRVLATNTIMQTLEDRDRLAVETIDFASSLR